VNVTATEMFFEQRYDDGSGVQYAVRLVDDGTDTEIEFESVDGIRYPIEQLDWLIACLVRIRDELVTPDQPNGTRNGLEAS
jgi:hypothetical protein